jgi:hypothetical protein
VTAEVVLINRRAVVLAADSAISIGRGDDVKIFNSAEKIFELCEQHPIGLMIYNSVNLLGTPLEMLAREFRATCKPPFRELADCADAFFKFMLEQTQAVPEKVAHGAIRDRIDDLGKEINQKAFEQYFAAPRQGRPPPDQWFVKVIEAEVANLAKTPNIDSHKDLTWQDLYTCDGAAIDSGITAIRSSHVTIDDNQAQLLKELVCRKLLSSSMSGNESGIVIAGYGETGMFPTLVSREIDGFVCGRLRTGAPRIVKIEPGEQTVDIITFAQEDISRRLLDGIDPAFRKSILAQTVKGLAQLQTAALQNAPPAATQMLEADFAAAAKQFVRSVLSAINDSKIKFNSEFYQTVASMPKQEMAFFAEALVNTTAMKRRVSADREDVGGPVDVAVISRHDGFIWVKRKHYFDADRNPRFIARKHATTLQAKEGAGDQASKSKSSGKSRSGASKRGAPPPAGGNDA